MREVEDALRAEGERRRLQGERLRIATRLRVLAIGYADDAWNLRESIVRFAEQLERRGDPDEGD